MNSTTPRKPGRATTACPCPPGAQRWFVHSDYRVIWTNLGGNPSFESIKFESFGGSSFRNRAKEYFTITVEDYRSDYIWNLQGHAGSTWETFSGL